MNKQEELAVKSSTEIKERENNYFLNLPHESKLKLLYAIEKIENNITLLIMLINNSKK